MNFPFWAAARNHCISLTFPFDKIAFRAPAAPGALWRVPGGTFFYDFCMNALARSDIAIVSRQPLVVFREGRPSETQDFLTLKCLKSRTVVS